MTDANAETTDRLQPVRDWLKKHDAKAMWEQAVSGVGSVSLYLVNQRPLLLLVYYTVPNVKVSNGEWEPVAHVTGWELFVPASGENNVAATFAGAEKACGLAE